MHVLIIPSEYYVPDFAPTAGIFQQDHARLLREKGHTVGVLSLKPRFSFPEFKSAMLGRKNKRTKISRLELTLHFIRNVLFPIRSLIKFQIVEDIPVFRFIGSYAFIDTSNSIKVQKFWSKIGDAALTAYIKKYGKPDVLHIHNVWYSGSIGKELERKYRIPFVLTERSSVHFMGNPKSEAIEIAVTAYNEITNLYAVSPGFARNLERKYNLKENSISWFPNMMDKTFENEPIQAEDKPRKTEDFVFLNVANLIPLKGQLDLITAFAKLLDVEEGIYLKIAGEGSTRKQLEELIVELGISKNVELCGFLDRKAILEEMKKCNAFVFPSHFETFGVVLIEAAALGKPLIATKCGGPECIVNQTNGLLVEPRNANELSLAMQQIVTNIEKYNPKKIKANILEQFGSEAFYKNFMNISNKAIDDYHN